MSNILDALRGQNLYDLYHASIESAGAGKVKREQSFEIRAAREMLASLHRVFKRHGVKPDDYRTLGNLVLRLTHFMAGNEEKISLDTEGWPEHEAAFVHFLFDLYEELNKEVESHNMIPDGQHRHSPGGIHDPKSP